ncbi:hypothetical protein MRX96_010401 [Rhipicephalus microplus]
MQCLYFGIIQSKPFSASVPFTLGAAEPWTRYPRAPDSRRQPEFPVAAREAASASPLLDRRACFRSTNSGHVSLIFTRRPAQREPVRESAPTVGPRLGETQPGPRKRPRVATKEPG